MSKNRLYLVLCSAITAGYGWLAWALWYAPKHSSFSPCPIKYITGIPCPSCGSTRSLVALAQGHFTEALLINPLGLFAAAVMLTFPLWLLYDVVFKKDTLYKSFKVFENTLKIKWVAITFTVLIAANWAWNIYKGL